VHWAAHEGKYDLVRLLLAHDAAAEGVKANNKCGAHCASADVSMVGRRAFSLSLCSWTARSCARDKDAFDRAVKVRVAINCAAESLRARLEEMRPQGAKDDAPAILLKMDVAKKGAAVRMPLSLFPDVGLLCGVRAWCQGSRLRSACIGIDLAACRKGPLLAVRNFAHRSDAPALSLGWCLARSWHSRPARS
jgi:hypothetical protein